ncbi:NADP-dependent succinic semialdehyde dehydrogenase [Micromonospora parathelypteridis]|uniref:Succinate-semialdehyde dehydrogenase/glutarate-semialdehyde dehydrogenase n=1 Tax=Micromonospora parathelypteridis TaxID=1839617 RepID=A0A840W829_9ACTN|nr:NADP-dependent succinic semialdehyde dehydrogenase [Micromonospora parathelypteridis]MBB5480309.1 succinate-semialdehyde dehydrogenase/glutarate-semialdehyde dehydrogenase [Micromonospora parathelypteridis]GGO23988.1 succinate-semialdehyde dehydrogenase [Micromonospora parathelypteridis]
MPHIATTNPATGQVLKTYEAMSTEQLDGAIERTDLAYRQLRDTTVDQRARWMNAAADLLDAERDEIARIMTTEMGKTYVAAQAEVTKCATAARFYADRAPAFLADEPADAAAVKAVQAFIRYQPIGVVLAVMPWNFPLWQVMRFAAPALMAGNTGLLKHASNVPQTALLLEDVFRRAGFPEGAFTTVLVGSEAVERILADPRVRAATLTGSEPAGRSIAQIAGRELKKTVLELGGSDPFVVMPSADLDRAAEVATTARCQNNGQSCIAAKRFIVHTDVFDAFAEKFAANMAALRVGDPMDPNTDVGPLASERGRDEVHAQVRDAADNGATVLCGGEPPTGDGWYYPPTVVTDLTPQMRMWSEEVFGPVAGLFRVSSYEEAIEVANGTSFGLGSNAWTRDPAEQERFATDLDAGNVFINGMTTSYPELPFGGVKNSGYGRELSALGMREFCNTKTVWVGEGAASAGAGAHAE